MIRLNFGWWMLAAIASGACGDDGGGQTPDAPAQPPAIIRADSIGCFETELYDRFVVNRADGTAVGGTTRIEAGGRLLDVEAGDAVTAANDFGRVQTVLGVESGDRLTFGDACGPPHTIAEITVTWEAAPGAAYYTACTECDCMPTSLGGELSATPSPCDDAEPGTEDLAVFAHADTSEILHMAWRADTAVSAGATVAAGPWQAAASVSLAIEALPSGGVGAPVVQSAIRASRSSYVAIRADNVVTPATITRSAAPVARQVLVSAQRGNQLVIATIPAGTPTATIDVPDRLPEVSDFAFDPTTRRVSFQVDGTGYDGAVVAMVWRLGDGAYRTWRVIVPPGTTSFTLPAHPAMPETAAAETGQLSFARVALIEGTDLASYADVRRIPLLGLGQGIVGNVADIPGVVHSATFETTFP